MGECGRQRGGNRRRLAARAHRWPRGAALGAGARWQGGGRSGGRWAECGRGEKAQASTRRRGRPSTDAPAFARLGRGVGIDSSRAPHARTASGRRSERGAHEGLRASAARRPRRHSARLHRQRTTWLLYPSPSQ